MKASFRKIDMYGQEVTFTMFGFEKFRTVLGALFTITTILLMLIFSWFFGNDFYFKSNPTVVFSERPKAIEEFLLPTTDVHTFMFRIQKGGTFEYIDYESTPFTISAAYTHYKLNDAGEVKPYFLTNNALTRCSETKAKQNKNLNNYKLEQWFCVDWEKIAEIGAKKLKKQDYWPIFGGLPGDFEYGRFFFNMLSCKITDEKGLHDFKTPEQVKAFNLNNVQAISVFPSYSFDANNQNYPIDNIFSENSVYLDLETIRLHTSYMQQNNLEDDRGYIFKDIRTTKAMKKTEIKTDTNRTISVVIGNPIWQPHLSIFFLDSLEVYIYRRYMVFQELCALVGGFMKFVIFGFFLLSTYNTHFEKNRFLANKMYQSKTDNLTGNVSMELKPVKIDTIVQKSKNVSNENKYFSLSASAYYFQCWGRKSEQFQHQTKLIELMRREIERKLDIRALFIFYSKFEKLAEMLCSEEQKIELHNLANLEMMN